MTLASRMETCSLSQLFRIKRWLGGVLSFIRTHQRLWERRRRAQSLCRRVGESRRGNLWCVVAILRLSCLTFYLNRNMTVLSMFLISNCRKCFLFLLQLSHSLKSSGCTSGLPAAPPAWHWLCTRLGWGRGGEKCFVFLRGIFLKPPQRNNKLLKLSFCI